VSRGGHYRADYPQNKAVSDHTRVRAARAAVLEAAE
jgi:hypothetical protein